MAVVYLERVTSDGAHICQYFAKDIVITSTGTFVDYIPTIITAGYSQSSFANRLHMNLLQHHGQLYHLSMNQYILFLVKTPTNASFLGCFSR